MITCVSVSKRFARNYAVEKLTFSLKPGDVFGFVGPNGAGKTTTMRLILGLLKPTSGQIRVFGEDPMQLTQSHKSQIGFLPENNPLYGDITVNEYLSFIANVKNEYNLSALIAKLHLVDVLEKRIQGISRGYRQRVGLAAALCGDPSLLLLDEPTSGLDPIEQDAIKSLIRTIAKKKAVLFSTHILSEAEDIANGVLLINRGRLIYQGTKPRGKGSLEKLFKTLVKKDEEHHQ